MNFNKEISFATALASDIFEPRQWRLSAEDDRIMDAMSAFRGSTILSPNGKEAVDSESHLFCRAKLRL